MTERASHIRVSGQVQGVGFRAWVCDLAQSQGVAGWVRNLADGSVEAHVEGPAERVEDVVATLHGGPPAALVEQVDATETEFQHFSGFELRHD